MRLTVVVAGLTALLTAAPALAVQCEPPGGFTAFIKEFRQHAAAEGIGRRGLAALDGLTLDRDVLARDHHQGIFHLDFDAFSNRLISHDRMVKGVRHLHRMAHTFARIERRYGVPGPVLVAIWGLETDYGVNLGHTPIVRAVATLAYDCRRSDEFQTELLDALRIVDAGDLKPSRMRGLWAGEIGQTQFVPSSYLKYAVDFDGHGGPDLVHNSADALASTANYLHLHGWQRGADWGPGQPNFDVIKSWNKSDVYARTIALFAHKLQAAAKN